MVEKIVSIKTRVNTRFPGTTYAEARDVNGELLMAATLDHVVRAAGERGWTLVVAR